MSIVWSQVVDICPSASTAPAGMQTYILDAVNNRWIDDDAWGDLADDGRRFLAAHIAKISGGAGGSGIVTSESIGAMSRSYAVPTGIVGSLGLSVYGMEYKRLVGLLPDAIGRVV